MKEIDLLKEKLQLCFSGWGDDFRITVSFLETGCPTEVFEFSVDVSCFVDTGYVGVDFDFKVRKNSIGFFEMNDLYDEWVELSPKNLFYLFLNKNKRTGNPGIEAQEVMDVWAVWKSLKITNTNPEEFPVAVCNTQATAMRIEKEFKSAGGSAVVTKEISMKVNDVWLVPGHIIPPTILDDKAQRRIDALKRAEEAGLSQEDLQALSEG